MNEYFTNQTKVSYPDRQIEEIVSNIDNPLCELYLNTNEVHDILSSADTTKATGPDGISNVMFLKTNARLFAAPFSEVFNLSLTEKTFPQVWKEASVVPIH